MFVWQLHYALLKGAFCYADLKGPVRFKTPHTCPPRSGFVQDWIMFFPKPMAPGDAREHNQFYQDASTSIHFSFSTCRSYSNERVSCVAALASGSCLISLS